MPGPCPKERGEDLVGPPVASAQSARTHRVRGAGGDQTASLPGEGVADGEVPAAAVGAGVGGDVHAVGAGLGRDPGDDVRGVSVADDEPAPGTPGQIPQRPDQPGAADGPAGP